MKINLRRCFFHSIAPIYRKNIVTNVEEGRIDRLKIMLKSGYIFPGKMLDSIMPSDFDSYSSKGNCVFLAQHSNTELPSYGGSFYNGEFSAFSEHIVGNPAWVFDENIVNDKTILECAHFLSEEICVKEPINLHDAVAVMLPYEAPSTTITRFLMYKEFQIFDDDYYDKEVKQILDNRDECLKSVYLKVDRWRSVLTNGGYYIPCINPLGMELDLNKELSFISENEEVVRKLLKK